MKFSRKSVLFPTLTFMAALLLLITSSWSLVRANEDAAARLDELQARIDADLAEAQIIDLELNQPFPCVNGIAANAFPCHHIDLMSRLPIDAIGGGVGNDIWGWTDPQTGHEYALMGRSNGTAFVDVTDPNNPIYIGNLPTHTTATTWRDVKVYADHAFIVSEAGGHGMQVFDLNQLRNVNSPPVTFLNTAHYSGFGNAHNIVINEDTGYAYAVGTSTCASGLHMVDISRPLTPTFAGCFSDDGYTHDAQCVMYHGPDTDYQGHEICINSNTDTVTIVDVTDKSAPLQLSRTGYAGHGYTHQGWLTEDQTYFLLGDEVDELNFGHNTYTHIWDLTDLDNPILMDTFVATTAAIDHNMYTDGDWLYQSNYRAGLRILDMRDISNGNLTETAFFDVYPIDDNASFSGTWSNYPYFDSGTIIVSTFNNGLFLLKRDYAVGVKSTFRVADANQTIVHQMTLTNKGSHDDAYTLSVSGNSWPTTLLTNFPISVSTGMTTTVLVEVTAPAGSDEDTFTLTATSVTTPSISYDTATGTTAASIVPNVSLKSTGSTKTAEPGTTVTHTIYLTNTGSHQDTFSLSLSGYQWPTTAPATTPALAPQASTIIPIIVHIPAMEQRSQGDLPSDSVTLTATSSWDVSVQAQVTVHTIADLEADITIPGDSLETTATGNPGNTITYQLTVTNTGQYTDTFTVALSNNTWDTTTSHPTIGPLGIGQSDTIDINVTVGALGEGTQDELLVTLTSSLDSEVSQTITFVTTSTATNTYLPLIYLNTTQ